MPPRQSRDTRYPASVGEQADVALENIRGELDKFLSAVEPHLAHALEVNFIAAVAQLKATLETGYLREVITEHLHAQLADTCEARAEWYADDPLTASRGVA